MAAIWKRGNYWRVEIRRLGHPKQNRTFDTKAKADAWARQVEAKMDRGEFVDLKEAERNTLGDLLLHYSADGQTLSEEERLLAELELKPRTASGAYASGGCRNEYARPAVILAIETAMRRSELLGLRWPDVYLADRYVRLHDSKNGEARDVPLSTRAVQILTELSEKPRHASGRVLLISPEALKKSFTRACERAGIKNLHFHDLRHEATSRIAYFYAPLQIERKLKYRALPLNWCR